MKSLIHTVKSMSVKAKNAGNHLSFLDHTFREPGCQKLIEQMNNISLESLGITGQDDPYHFKENLNRITIEGSDDYRLVLFFIKKGQKMPLHDHPNMCVFFRMLFGKLNYRSYDKVDEKFRYNKFSLDEYMELLETKKRVKAKIVNNTVLHGPQFLMVRPSRNNLHQFIAEENTCFFDICLPNYTSDSLRRITYFNDVGEVPALQEGEIFKPVVTEIEYDTTPPRLPNNFTINEVSYRGELKEDETMVRRGNILC